MKITIRKPHRLQEADMCEMAMIARNVKENFVIYVNSDPDHLGDEYFKVYNNQVYGVADCVARIAMRRPEYIIHSNSDGKKNYVLNFKERRNLVKLLNAPNKNIKFEDGTPVTNWQAAIVIVNADYGMDQEDTLKYTRDCPKNKDYMRIDDPMPDYLQLPSP